MYDVHSDGTRRLSKRPAVRGLRVGSADRAPGGRALQATTTTGHQIEYQPPAGVPGPLHEVGNQFYYRPLLLLQATTTTSRLSYSDKVIYGSCRSNRRIDFRIQIR